MHPDRGVCFVLLSSYLFSSWLADCLLENAAAGVLNKSEATTADSEDGTPGIADGIRPSL